MRNPPHAPLKKNPNGRNAAPGQLDPHRAAGPVRGGGGGGETSANSASDCN